MMSKARRLLLQVELEGYLNTDPRVSDPSEHVSFQPSEMTKIKYPHIVYSRPPAYQVHADNIPYVHIDKYEVQLIDRDPDSPIFDELLTRAHCSHTTTFVEDGLHHSVFDLYH